MLFPGSDLAALPLQCDREVVDLVAGASVVLAADEVARLRSLTGGTTYDYVLAALTFINHEAVSASALAVRRGRVGLQHAAACVVMPGDGKHMDPAAVMSVWALVLAAVGAATCHAASFNISSSSLILGFTEGKLSTLSKPGGPNLIVTGSTPPPLWSIDVVTASGKSTVTSDSSTCTVAASTTATAANLTWTQCSDALAVTMAVSVAPQASVADTVLTATVVKPGMSLWQATMTAGGLAVDGAEVFFPSGYGVSSPPSSGASFHGSYPSSSAAMAFMAVGDAYFASHDSQGSMKTLTATKASAAAGTPSLPPCGQVPSQQSTPNVSNNLCQSPQHTSGTPSAALSVSMVLPGAGQTATTTWSSPPFAIGVTNTPGTPTWYAAAMVYRQWALASAPWAQAGPISSRPDFPSWLRTTALWSNTGWQCHDVFNDTQGAPATVASAVPAIKALFNQDMALHWYEFQQGPDPSPAARYRFDTHYPDYFPARKNFSAVVEALLADDVYTFPYINGRIFDINSESYKKDNGELYVTRSATPLLDTPHTSLYQESYGSGATFNVADPSSQYWQGKLTSTVEKLVNVYGTQGVYIDQIGAASPTPDWTPAHAHFGGGGWWVNGQEAMVADIRKNTSAPLVTESNAETVLHIFSGLLTLVAFNPALAESSQYLTPAFPAIYGGLFNGFGSVFTQSDFAPNPDVVAARFAAQLAYGAQLGWFSIGGQADDTCGAMATGDLWLSSEHAPEVSFVNKLTAYRKVLLPYLLDGALAAPFSLSPIPPPFSSPTNTHSKGPFNSVQTAAWFDASRASVLLLCVVPVRTDPSPTTATVTLSTYSFPSGATPTFTKVLEDGSKQPVAGATVADGVASVPLGLAARDVVAIIVA